MFLGTALIIGGLWWAWDVKRRPDHSPRDYRGPLIMTGIGILVLAGFVFWLGVW